MTVRMGETYVANGQLTQAGYSALRGTETAVAALEAADAALDARVDVLEGRRVQMLLASKTASASATLDFTEFSNATYRVYLLELEAVKPATDAVTLQIRLSTNGGSSYDAGATDYAFVGTVLAVGGAVTGLGSGGAAAINVTFAADVGNAGGERGVTGRIWLFLASQVAQTRIAFDLDYDNTSTVFVRAEGRGTRRADQDTDAIRFFYSSGNIASGTIRMYGLN